MVGLDGIVVSSYRFEPRTDERYRSIHGQAYGAGYILHPTDDGIVKETIGKKAETIGGTEPYLSSDDSIVAYSHGLLVIKDRSVGLMGMA